MIGLSCIISSNNSHDHISIRFSSIEVFLAVSKNEQLFSSIIIEESSEHDVAISELDAINSRLVPGGTLVFSIIDLLKVTEHSASLVIGGFIDVKALASDGKLTCTKPDYNTAAMSLGVNNVANDKKKTALKSLLQDDSADDDFIDDDELISEGDLIPPIPGAGNNDVVKRKRACKNCSCGLNELEQKEELIQAKTLNGKISAPKSSSCGSCSRGDAFRCSGCPYSGTPAFDASLKPKIFIKPDGSKVLLDVDADYSIDSITKPGLVESRGSKILIDNLGSI